MAKKMDLNKSRISICRLRDVAEEKLSKLQDATQKRLGHLPHTLLEFGDKVFRPKQS